MQLEKADEMHGGFSPIIDYPENLSVDGKRYFLRSLESWKKNLQTKLHIKLEGMNNTEIMEEEKIERQAYLSCQLSHDAVNGPISVLRTHAQLAVIDQAIKSVTEENIDSDVELFKTMHMNAPEVIIHDAEVTVEDEFGTCHPSENKTSKVMLRDEHSIDYFLFKDSVYELIKYFRISQFDVLQPLEKDFLLCEMHRENANPVLLSSYDLTEKAYSNKTADDRDEEIDALYDMHVVDILPVQAKSFLKLYQTFSAMEENNDNAYNYLVALQVINAFENLQILLQESFEDISYGQILDMTDQGKYEVALDYDAYKNIINDKPSTRLNLPSYDDLIENINEGNLDSIDYDDFTRTFREGMSEEGTKSFDNYLQGTLTSYAKELCLPTVNVKEFHEFIRKYDTPCIKG